MSDLAESLVPAQAGILVDALRMVDPKPNRVTPMKGAVRNFLVSPDTTPLLREANRALLSMLWLFMDGEHSGDGAAIGIRGKLRARTTIKKKNVKKQGDDDPAQTDEEAVYESLETASKRGIRVAWGEPVKAEWKRLVIIAAHPFMFIDDVRVYDPSIGEPAALRPMLETIRNAGLPLNLVRWDGGLNGSVSRDIIIEFGAQPVIPYGRNAVNAYNADPAVVAKLRYFDGLQEAFDFWRYDPEGFYALYSPRSLAENVVSCWKGKRDKFACWTGAGPENEALLMQLNRNIHLALMLVFLAKERQRIAA